MLGAMSDPRLETIQRLFVESIFDPEIIPCALQEFADFCDADIGHLMVADGSRTLLESAFSVQVDPDLAALESQLQHINPRVLAIPKMRAMKATRDKDFITRQAMEKDAVYQELILPLGLGHFSGVPIINSSALTAGIALHRPIGKEAFNDDEAHRHELAAAVCQPVFALAHMIEKNRAKSSVDMFGSAAPVAALKASGEIIDFNASFEHLLQSAEVRIGSDKKIRFLRESDTRKADSILNESSCVIGGKFVSSDQVGRPRYVVNVLPVQRVGIVGDLAGAAVMIFMPIRGKVQLNRPLVEDAFGFTTAEAHTAELLVQGNSLQQISEIRDVSAHTTRTLIKRIFAKTECSRQAELVALLLPFLD